jgi:20S proteasome subunit beta 6
MGALYHYDAVGSKERVRATCAGKGEQLMQAFLDELTDMERDDGLWNFSSDGSEFTSSIDVITSLSREDAISVAIKAFKAAAEREISIGDGVHIVVISKVSNEDEEFSIESQIVPLPAH